MVSWCIVRQEDASEAGCIPSLLLVHSNNWTLSNLSVHTGDIWVSQDTLAPPDAVSAQLNTPTFFLSQSSSTFN
jgi:hypothetical protein